MKRVLLSLIITGILPFTANAAEFIIHETDSVIIVEYNGEADHKTDVGRAADPKTAAKQAEVAPALPAGSPLKVATAKVVETAAKDDEEAPSARSKEKIEQSLERAKKRTARAARAAKKNRDLSTANPDEYYQPEYIFE